MPPWVRAATSTEASVAALPTMAQALAVAPCWNEMSTRSTTESGKARQKRRKASPMAGPTSATASGERTLKTAGQSTSRQAIPPARSTTPVTPTSIQKALAIASRAPASSSRPAAAASRLLSSLPSPRSAMVTQASIERIAMSAP